MDFYVLDKRNRPVIESDERVWSAWVESDPRRIIRSSDWEAEDGHVEVVTVFLGFNALGTTPPALWDTVAKLYPTGHDDFVRIDQWHYTSKAQALRGHDQMVRALGGSVDPDGWKQTLLSVVPAGLVTMRVVGGQLFTLLDGTDGRVDGVIHFLGRCLRP